MMAMTARRHHLLPYFALMATVGSVLGCALTDLIGRKGGEEGLAKRASPKRLEYVTDKIKKNAGWALAFASLMPPPFPFTSFVAAASALQYPRRKLLTVIALTRLVRFSIEGLLAVIFGRKILRLAQSPAVEYAILALMVISMVGSALSVYSWIRASRKPRGSRLPGGSGACRQDAGATDRP